MFETRMEVLGKHRVVVSKNESSPKINISETEPGQGEAEDKKYLTPRIGNPIKKVQRIYMG